eukprot:14926431-Alexandrium_andersonii.AAC.1
MTYSRLGHEGVRGIVDHDNDVAAEVPLVRVGVAAHAGLVLVSVILRCSNPAPPGRTAAAELNEPTPADEPRPMASW